MIDIDPTWRAAPERSDAATLAVTTTSTKKRSAWRTQIRHDLHFFFFPCKKTSSKILKISVRHVFFPTNTWRKMFGINPQHDYDTFALRCHQLRWKIPPFRWIFPGSRARPASRPPPAKQHRRGHSDIPGDFGYIWLVVYRYTYPSEKYDFVSWDDSQYMEK